MSITPKAVTITVEVTLNCQPTFGNEPTLNCCPPLKSIPNGPALKGPPPIKTPARRKHARCFQTVLMPTLPPNGLYAFASVYAGSKHAVEGITKSPALEGAGSR